MRGLARGIDVIRFILWLWHQVDICVPITAAGRDDSVICMRAVHQPVLSAHHRLNIVEMIFDPALALPTSDPEILLWPDRRLR